MSRRETKERDLDLLLRVDDKLRPLIEAEEITLTAASILGAHLKVNRCAYADVEGDANTFNLTGDYNTGVDSIVGRYRFDEFGRDCLRLLRSGKPFVVSDSELDSRTRSVVASYRATQIRSVVCVPLLKGRKLVAAMAVHQKKPRRWKENEVDLILRVASRCWESIERSRLTRELLMRSAVVSSSSDAIFTKSLGGIITSWNASAQRIFGYTAKEALGQPVTMLFAPDHVNEEPQIMSRIRRGILVEPYDTIRRRKDGSLVPVSLTVSPIRNQGGIIVGASAIARDISSQKAYEKRLLDQAAELEQFAYVVSHDLQEPLRKMSVYTDLLAKQISCDPGGDGEKYASLILGSVSRMRNLIGELLNYSRTAHGVSHPEPIDLNKTLREVLSDLEVPIRESGAKISVGSLPTIDGSSFQLHQLFQNLISNALKFRDARSPVIQVSAETNAVAIRIRVKDNGIGIEPEYHEKIFRVFQRLHAGSRYPGTGIGLAICKKIVENMRGRIWVESKTRVGTSVHIQIPKV